MRLWNGLPSGSSGCGARVSSSPTRTPARRSARRRRRTAAASRDALSRKRSSSCSGHSASCRRWTSCCATSSAGSSTSRHCATAARSTSAGRPARTRSATGTTRTPGMADASRSDIPIRAPWRRLNFAPRVAGGGAPPSRSDIPIRATWRRLNFEQRVAGVAALLLVVSTFGPFSFVEAATILTAGAVLVLLRKRAEGAEFHIPFGDGSVIAAAGAWSAFLILVRLPVRPPGQTFLALACAAVLFIAGGADRRKRPPDDLPGPAPEQHQRGPEAVEWEEPTERLRRSSRGRGRVGASDAPTEVRHRRSTPEGATQPMPQEPAATEEGQLELTPEPPPNEPLPPPEFKLPGDER